MQMIADKLGVTKVSVSKALRNQEGVSNELREKVLDTARAMGYTRSRKGDGQAIQHLGFLEPKKYFLESGDFFTQVYYHLLQDCSARRIRLHLHVLSEEEETSPSMPFPFEQSLMDGVFVGGELCQSCLEKLSRHNVPTIAIGFYEVHNAIDAIIVDDYYNSNQITNKLVEMGHTEIGFLGDYKCAHSALDRYFGFLKGLEENDLPFREQWLISDVDEHGRVITDYELPDKLPTAFICHSDVAANNLRLKLESLGMSVPRDMAMATFDNTDIARQSKAVICLDVTGRKFAEAALKQMLWRRENMDAEHQRVILNAPLIVRDCTHGASSESEGRS
jgi:LacI family transcriptional regulator